MNKKPSFSTVLYALNNNNYKMLKEEFEVKGDILWHPKTGEVRVNPEVYKNPVMQIGNYHLHQVDGMNDGYYLSNKDTGQIHHSFRYHGSDPEGFKAKKVAVGIVNGEPRPPRSEAVISSIKDIHEIFGSGNKTSNYKATNFRDEEDYTKQARLDKMRAMDDEAFSRHFENDYQRQKDAEHAVLSFNVYGSNGFLGKHTEMVTYDPHNDFDNRLYGSLDGKIYGVNDARMDDTPDAVYHAYPDERPDYLYVEPSSHKKVKRKGNKWEEISEQVNKNLINEIFGFGNKTSNYQSFNLPDYEPKPRKPSNPNEWKEVACPTCNDSGILNHQGAQLRCPTCITNFGDSDSLKFYQNTERPDEFGYHMNSSDDYPPDSAHRNIYRAIEHKGGKVVDLPFDLFPAKSDADQRI